MGDAFGRAFGTLFAVVGRKGRVQDCEKFQPVAIPNLRSVMGEKLRIKYLPFLQDQFLSTFSLLGRSTLLPPNLPPYLITREVRRTDISPDIAPQQLFGFIVKLEFL